jgi:glucokinase
MSLILIADIGGTNARFALADGVSPVPLHPQRVPTASFASFEQAALAFLSAGNHRVDGAVIAGAGPVVAGQIKLTNAQWVIDEAAIRRDLKLGHCTLVNDFEAMAFAVPFMNATQTTVLGPEKPTQPGPILILGPGTGFGAALLLPHGHAFHILPSEAAHASLGTADALPVAVTAVIERVEGRLTIEGVLSGEGLERLYGALCMVAGEPAPLKDAAAIQAAALLAPASKAGEALTLFAHALGAVAGDLALVHKATGGVLVAGGIVPRLLDFAGIAAFRTAFDAKAPMHDILAKISTRVITDPAPALIGLAAYAAEPERFIR